MQKKEENVSKILMNSDATGVFFDLAMNVTRIAPVIMVIILVKVENPLPTVYALIVLLENIKIKMTNPVVNLAQMENTTTNKDSRRARMIAVPVLTSLQIKVHVHCVTSVNGKIKTTKSAVNLAQMENTTMNKDRRHARMIAVPVLT